MQMSRRMHMERRPAVKLTQKQICAMQKSNNESNQMTRDSIKTALIDLLKEHDYQKIRITEIINLAHVSRSAFYHNYKTKQDIMIDMFHDAFADITGSGLRLSWETVFSYVKANEWKIRLLMKAGLQQYLLKSMNEAGPGDYQAALWNGMIYNAILHYAESGFPDPAEAARQVRESLQDIAGHIHQ